MTTPALGDGPHPDAVYVVTARHGGPVRYSSWSRAYAVREKNKLQGDFVVVKYDRAPHRVTTATEPK